MAKELEAESYHDIKRITARKDNVIRLWEYLLELLKARRQRLEMNLGLQRVFQEMLYIMDWMDEMKVPEHSTRGGTQRRCLSRNVIVCFWVLDAAAVSGLWEASAGGGGPAPETRLGGGRHCHPGRQGEGGHRQRQQALCQQQR